MTRTRLLLLLGLLLASCATPLPYAPDDRLIQRDGAQVAIGRLAGLLQRTTLPLLSDVKVTDAAMEFRVHYAGQLGPQPGMRRITWDRVVRVDIYANHRTFVYDQRNRELVWLEFDSDQQARDYADLVMSFRGQALAARK